MKRSPWLALVGFVVGVVVILAVGFALGVPVERRCFVEMDSSGYGVPEPNRTLSYYLSGGWTVYREPTEQSILHIYCMERPLLRLG